MTEHPTSSQINDIQKSQGPPVKKFDPSCKGDRDREFSEQRDTMKPEKGMMMPQQKAKELKEDGRADEAKGIDLEIHGERDDEKQMPVPPAEKKAGMRT